MQNRTRHVCQTNARTYDNVSAPMVYTTNKEYVDHERALGWARKVESRAKRTAATAVTRDISDCPLSETPSLCSTVSDSNAHEVRPVSAVDPLRRLAAVTRNRLLTQHDKPTPRQQQLTNLLKDHGTCKWHFPAALLPSYLVLSSTPRCFLLMSSVISAPSVDCATPTPVCCRYHCRHLST